MVGRRLRFTSVVAVVSVLVGLMLPAAPAAGAEPMGELRVTTNPAVASVIRVDGQAMDTWGLTWVDLAVGSHQVCFGDVPGYATPPCQSTTITAGSTSTVTGNFTQLTPLQVFTSPAVPGVITVRDIVAGTPAVPRDSWGLNTYVVPGRSIEVCFGPAADFAPPACQTVAGAALVAGVLHQVTGVYAPSPGASGPVGTGLLRVTTSPAVPATVRVAGVARDTWGLDWLALAPGSYQVCFSGITGWRAPGCQTAEVTAGATTTVDGVFTQQGYLRATTSPAAEYTVVVDSIPRNDYGVWFPVDPGSHEVCFDYELYDCRWVTVEAGQTSETEMTTGPANGGVITRVTDQVASARDASISDDGQYVAFKSFDGTLAGGDDNGAYDLFLWHRGSGAITRITDAGPVGPGDWEPHSQDPVISGDGSTVAFLSYADDLAAGDTHPGLDAFIWSRTTGTTTRVSPGPDGVTLAIPTWSSVDISDDGRYVVFCTAAELDDDDDNMVEDSFVWDRTTGSPTRISDDASGVSVRPQISGDGRYVSFLSTVGGDGVEAHVWDRQTSTTQKITSAGDGEILKVDLADNGDAVFHTSATNIAPPDTNGLASDVFVWRRTSGTTTRVTNADNSSYEASLSADGRYVLFTSEATNLIAGEEHHVGRNAYVWDSQSGLTTLVVNGNRETFANSMTADGSSIALTSWATNLDQADSGTAPGVFVWDRPN